MGNQKKIIHHFPNPNDGRNYIQVPGIGLLPKIVSCGIHQPLFGEFTSNPQEVTCESCLNHIQEEETINREILAFLRKTEEDE